MLLVSEIQTEAARILGSCDDAELFDRISDAVKILCNKCDIDPTKGVVDIAVSGSRFVTLPREVETVLALNIDREPTRAHDRLFEFHLNGAGSDDGPRNVYSWSDKGDFPVFLDPQAPSQLSAYSSVEDDTAAELWVYGYDQNDQWIVSYPDGVLTDGYKVPVGSLLGAFAGPLFKRITKVRKSTTLGFVNLYAKAGTEDPVLISVYEPKDTLPAYRRIILSQDATWVRVQFRRKIYRVTSENDIIPFDSRYALFMMLKALQKYDNDKPDVGAAYEQKAIEYMVEEQLARNPTTSPTLQVSPSLRLVANNDRMT